MNICNLRYTKNNFKNIKNVISLSLFISQYDSKFINKYEK